jgi:ribosomal protein S1
MKTSPRCSRRRSKRSVGKGQTIEGTIVAIGAEWRSSNVGGKGEALIEIAELKNDEGVSRSRSATVSRRWS